MEVLLLPEAWAELRRLPKGERLAMRSAIEKLEVLGEALPSPHSSAVQGVGSTLRELRPRSGRSPWRAFYRRIGQRMVIGAVGPEAHHDRRGFKRAVADARTRLDDDAHIKELGL